MGVCLDRLAMCCRQGAALACLAMLVVACSATSTSSQAAPAPEVELSEGLHGPVERRALGHGPTPDEAPGQQAPQPPSNPRHSPRPIAYEVAIPMEAQRLFEATWYNESPDLTRAKAQYGDFARLAFDVIFGPIGPYNEALLYIFEPERSEGFRTFILGQGPRGWEGHYVARLGPWPSSEMLAVIFEKVGEAHLPAPILTATYLHDDVPERRSPEFPYTSVVVWDGASFVIDEALEARLRGRYEAGPIREGLRDTPAD
ncbi:hypothetical protein DL240_15540 [Lujinxingia litoralis]|uniref:Uncharacterized protein n=1 Tax=Lujinxingia litoralis TaxID=2211119 RepID=A0A328C458_9DELT|nr:hypothetical protein [Lujinxingia litoralis]RAL20729.1 hypothetical protein DL240_15540 [Lujinxingia litoralis]